MAKKKKSPVKKAVKKVVKKSKVEVGKAVPAGVAGKAESING